MIEKRIAELGLELPSASVPLARYVPFASWGNMIFLAGQLPFANGDLIHKGRVGSDVDIRRGQAAARQCGINLLANLRLACAGNLDRVARCLKITGFVSSTEEFFDQAIVLNGCSELMIDVFGEQGQHARSAIGVSVLPFNAPVEIEAIFAVQ